VGEWAVWVDGAGIGEDGHSRGELSAGGGVLILKWSCEVSEDEEKR
jgi:hypothetical protein